MWMMLHDLIITVVQIICFITTAMYLPDPWPLVAAIVISFISATAQDRREL